MKRRMLCEEMLADWGERCPDFEPDCPTCQAWSSWDLSRRRNETEVDDTVDLIAKRNPQFVRDLMAIIGNKV